MEEKDLSTSLELDVSQLDEKTQKIAQEIIDTDDFDKVKDLTQLFNLHSQKRNVARVMKMNTLLDKVTDQVVERFEKYPNNFSNDDLIKYMQVTENAIEKANKNLNLVEEIPAIQLQQNNQININMDSSLDRESRLKVTETVHKILKNMKNSAITVEPENEDNVDD